VRESGFVMDLTRTPESYLVARHGINRDGRSAAA